MKIAGSSVLHAPPHHVWAAITDPAVLAEVIPGCDALTPIEANRFGLTVTLGVASIKGAYSGEVAFLQLQEPTSLTMQAKGSGGPGTIDTTVEVALTALADGTTRVDYDADAIVGGMVGGVGQRVLAGVAKKTAGLFFAAIDDVLTGVRTIGVAVPVEGRTERTPDLGSPTLPDAIEPAVAVTQQRPSTMSLLGAAALGALSMLVGVMVGARIGRRR